MYRVFYTGLWISAIAIHTVADRLCALQNQGSTGQNQMFFISLKFFSSD